MQTRKALDSGTSLIVFPEGKQRISHRANRRIEDGGFRMALQFGCPIVPVSVVDGSFNRKDRWWLHPSQIVVHIHDTIETNGLRKEDRAGVARPRARDYVRAGVVRLLHRKIRDFTRASSSFFPISRGS